MPLKALVVLLALIASLPTYAAEMLGKVEAIRGTVTIVDSDGVHRDAAVGEIIEEGQGVQTGADGEVHIATEDQGLLALRPNSIFQIERYQARGEASDVAIMHLVKGALRSVTGWIGKRDKAAYRLTTPVATIGIRGTDHEATMLDEAQADDAAGTYETVYEGVTVLMNAHGEIEILPGQFAFAPLDGSNPVLLTQPPRFSGERTLQLEDRIPDRKETLRKRLAEYLSDEQSGKLQDIRNQWERATDDQRARIKQRLRRKIQERRTN